MLSNYDIQKEWTLRLVLCLYEGDCDFCLPFFIYGYQNFDMELVLFSSLKFTDSIHIKIKVCYEPLSLMMRLHVGVQA